MRILKYRKTQRRSVKNAARHSGNAERVTMPVAKGDTVRVMRGDDKGKEGKITHVHLKTGRVVIDGVNIVKRHRKARSAEELGGIIDFPAPIHHSNVMLLDPKSGEPTRVHAHTDDAESDHKAARRAKERVSAKSGDTIPRPKR